MTEDGQIERYGLNAVCTHLGCVVSRVDQSCFLLGFQSLAVAAFSLIHDTLNSDTLSP